MAYQLPEIVTEWADEHVMLAGRELRLKIPAQPDQLLDHPRVQAENLDNDYMPYWGYLWPAARDMAALVVKANWRPGAEVIELGCGSGLIGLAALIRGMKVTFTDNRLEALQLAGFNAEWNSFSHFSTLKLDWLAPEVAQRFDYVIASDILYERKFHEPLLNLVPRLVAQKGEIWIADPGRTLMVDFYRLCQQRNWIPDIYDQNEQLCSFPRPGRFHLLVFEAAEMPQLDQFSS